MKEKFLPKSVIQAHFSTISLTYHLFWKKEEENKYKVEKHHIYNTMTPIFTITNSKKKNTHTHYYYLKTVQIKKNQIKI